MAQTVGLHLRCNEQLRCFIDKAIEFNLSSFQGFLRHPNGRLIRPEPKEVDAFRLFRQQCSTIFAHASYKINLADPRMPTHPALRDEVSLACQLGFSHMVIHPGATQNIQQGIDSVARQLNKLTKKVTDLCFVLENVAFGTPSVGGDINHLAAIISKVDKPERIGICIDTAHAYAYGYDMATDLQINDFTNYVFSTIGSDHLSLIHLNDTQAQLGSRHDIHCRIGTGNIGKTTLEKIVSKQLLHNTPIILELPLLDRQQEQEDLILVRSWVATHKKTL